VTLLAGLKTIQYHLWDKAGKWLVSFREVLVSPGKCLPDSEGYSRNFYLLLWRNSYK